LSRVDCGSSSKSVDELEGKGGDKNDSEQRGLILLHIVTDKGQVKLKERAVRLPRG
jgi:hypothetical protein